MEFILFKIIGSNFKSSVAIPKTSNTIERFNEIELFSKKLSKNIEDGFISFDKTKIMNCNEIHNKILGSKHQSKQIFILISNKITSSDFNSVINEIFKKCNYDINKYNFCLFNNTIEQLKIIILNEFLNISYSLVRKLLKSEYENNIKVIKKLYSKYKFKNAKLSYIEYESDNSNSEFIFFKTNLKLKEIFEKINNMMKDFDSNQENQNIIFHYSEKINSNFMFEKIFQYRYKVFEISPEFDITIINKNIEIYWKYIQKKNVILSKKKIMDLFN